MLTSGSTTTTERFAYDGWDMAKPGAIGSENFDVYADLNSSNSVTNRRLFGPSFDEPLARQDSSGVVAWYGTDQLGSVRTMFDNSGTVTGTRSYSAFGEITSETGTGLDRYAYTAREWDGAAGLQYSRARMYDPKIGRWTSEDPIGFAGGDSNLSRYVGNGATLARDPSGLCDLPTIGRIAAAGLPVISVLTDRVLEVIGVAESVNPNLANNPGAPLLKGAIAATGAVTDIAGKTINGKLEEAAASTVSVTAGTLSGSIILTGPVAVKDVIAELIGVDPALMRLLIPSNEHQAIEELTAIGNSLDPVNTDRGKLFAPIFDLIWASLLFGGIGGGSNVARGTATGVIEETLPPVRAGLQPVRPQAVRSPVGASPRVPPSKTPLEMVQGAKGQVPPAVEINFEHIIHGEVRTSVDASGNIVQRGVGGHYTRSGNVRITQVVEAADKNGVVVAKVEIRDPATGKWVPKRANSSLFPSDWTQRQLQIEVEGALRNSKPIGGDLWEGVSPSGLRIQGYYSKPNGGAVTAWPVHGS